MLKIFALTCYAPTAFCAEWTDAMRAHTDVPDATAPRNTLRYVYGICLT